MLQVLLRGPEMESEKISTWIFLQTLTSGRQGSSYVGLNVSVSGGDTFPFPKQGSGMETSNTSLSVNTVKEAAWQKKTQHSFACSGSGEPSSSTWEALQCYQWKLLCCSPCISALYIIPLPFKHIQVITTCLKENCLFQVLREKYTPSLRK